MMKRLLMIASMFALVAVLTVQASAKEITVRGHLEQTVEAGGWLIIADTDERTDKYLLLNPQRFRSETWFRKGAQVEATGETKPDAVTVYQEGIPFEARTMRSIGSKANEATSDIRPSRVIVSGDAIVQVQPSPSVLLISVVTQNKNALDAQTENQIQLIAEIGTGQ